MLGSLILVCALLSEAARQRTGDYLVHVATRPPDPLETAIYFLSLAPQDLRPPIITRWRRYLQRQQPGLEVPLVLAELGPGEVVGEMGVLDGGLRTASVTALEDVEALEVSYAAVALTLLQYPQAVTVLVRTLTQRLRATDHYGDLRLLHRPAPLTLVRFDRPPLDRRTRRLLCPPLVPCSERHCSPSTALQCE